MATASPLLDALLSLGEEQEQLGEEQCEEHCEEQGEPRPAGQAPPARSTSREEQGEPGEEQGPSTVFLIPLGRRFPLGRRQILAGNLKKIHRVVVTSTPEDSTHLVVANGVDPGCVDKWASEKGLSLEGKHLVREGWAAGPMNACAVRRWSLSVTSPSASLMG